MFHKSREEWRDPLSLLSQAAPCRRPLQGQAHHPRQLQALTTLVLAVSRRYALADHAFKERSANHLVGHTNDYWNCDCYHVSCRSDGDGNHNDHRSGGDADAVRNHNDDDDCVSKRQSGKLRVDLFIYIWHRTLPSKPGACMVYTFVIQCITYWSLNVPYSLAWAFIIITL